MLVLSQGVGACRPLRALGLVQFFYAARLIQKGRMRVSGTRRARTGFESVLAETHPYTIKG